MSKVTFMSTADFKAAIEAKSIKIVRNPKTDKLFGVSDNGIKLKCQQDIDMTQDISVLIEDNVLADACIVNVSETGEVIGSL